MSNLLPLRTASARRSQRGFSLIELMVAIAIALFIVLGLSILYVNMKTTFNSQDQLSQLQDGERLAVTMLTTTVQSAAYYPDPVNFLRTTALPLTTTANTDSTTFIAGQGITGTSGPAGGSDTIDVRYQTASGDGLMNCQGGTNTTGSTQTWVNSFAVDTTTHELTCAVNGGTAVALVGNVAQMTVLYGVDTDSNGFVDTYLSAATVTSTNKWASVQTAQVTLTFLNPLASQTGAAATLPNPWVQTISLMNQS